MSAHPRLATRPLAASTALLLSALTTASLPATAHADPAPLVHKPQVRVSWDADCLGLTIKTTGLRKDDGVHAFWHNTAGTHGGRAVWTGNGSESRRGLTAGSAHRVTVVVLRSEGDTPMDQFAFTSPCADPSVAASWTDNGRKLHVQANSWPAGYTMRLKWFTAVGELKGSTTVPAKNWGKYDFKAGDCAKVEHQVFAADGRDATALVRESAPFGRR